MQGVTFGRFVLAAIFLTLLAIVFIQANDEPFNGIFLHLMVAHDLPAAWLMAAILVLGYSCGARAWSNAGWVNELVLAIDRHRYLVAMALWVILCLGAIKVYHNHPLSMDEYAAVFQAKIFSAGAMHGQFPPELIDNLIPKPFQNYFLMTNHSTGAVFSAYWPGFSLLLAPFVWLGIPWACNPTLVALSLLLIARIARELVPSPFAAGWAMLLALASPAFVANGISYYSMSAHLLFNLAFAWLLLTPTKSRLFFAGLVGGCSLALHNPFPHAVFALPWVFWLLVRRGDRLRHVLRLAAGYLVMAGPLVFGWALWRQGVLQEGAVITSAVPAVVTSAPGLAERMWGLLLGFASALHWPDAFIIHARLGGLIKLWLWASPMLLLFAWWGGRKTKNVGIRLLGASALITFFSYFLIRFDQGHGWGYRYFHSAWGVLPIIGAAGILKLIDHPSNGENFARSVMVIVLVSMIASTGLRFFQMERFVGRHLEQFPPRAQSGFQLFVHNQRGYYSRDLIQNDPWLRGEFVVATVQAKEDASKLLAGFRDRFSTPPISMENQFGKTFASHPLK